ncbi:MAG TPA: hypothetical protein VMO75_01240 [Chthoniobacterales bacterium]|nr:hypothetical protein [Chthoniobacterales bacterium]
MDKFVNRLVAAIFGAWFCFALALGVSGAFESAGALVVALIVWGLTALVLLACWKNLSFRNLAATVPLRWLIALHLVRFIGIFFLVLASYDRLPGGFAKPAGIGDIIVAIGAVALLAMPGLRSWIAVLRIWNFFGFIDILFVVFSALRFGLQDWTSMAALRQLPLSLLPTFFVPLILASHVLIFVRLMTAGKVDSSIR